MDEPSYFKLLVQCGLVYTQCKWEEELASFLRLALQFPDETFTDAVETREKPTPQVLIAPEIVSSPGVNHRQICVARGRLLVVVRNRVLAYVTFRSVASLTTSKDDVAAFVGVGREEKY